MDDVNAFSCALFAVFTLLTFVNHGNLVRLEGFCIDPEDASCYLVYEYIENGSLHSWLHENNRGKLNWRARLRIAIDVANGLQYIHEHTRPQVVHKDIKSSNILLDTNMRAKIANFGLAKSGCNAITMHIVGTQGYIAPEYLTDGVVSPKMDVFAFGVVLLELLTGKEAIDDDGKVLWSIAYGVWEGTDEERITKMMDLIDKYVFKESCSVESLTNMMAVAVACVNKDPSKRPSMVDVGSFTQALKDPIFLAQFHALGQKLDRLVTLDIVKPPLFDLEFGEIGGPSGEDDRPKAQGQHGDLPHEGKKGGW
ncbi:hypothetical protein KSS87_018790 [Heliosperma pusillum]|nr:hypothetical protein KSS87_018790 [Heliosperma pusillum]